MRAQAALWEGNIETPEACMRAQFMSDSATPWTVAHQALLSLVFPRQEYWSELSFVSPEDLLHPWIEPVSPALAGRFFTTEPPGSPETTEEALSELDDGNFPGSPVVQTLHFHCRGHGFEPWLGKLRSCTPHGTAKNNNTNYLKKKKKQTG